jgi:hypothetical protein
MCDIFRSTKVLPDELDILLSRVDVIDWDELGLSA